MHRLVALDLPAGPAFLAEMERAFEHADAILPVDQRLPSRAKQRLFEALEPTDVVDPTGRQVLPGGRGVEDGDALVVATSGTSGEPKGVVLTRSAVEASARATSRRLGVSADHDGWLCCLPLSHVGGLSVCTRALFTGTPLQLQSAFSPEGTLEALDRGATLVSLVATALFRLEPSVIERFRVIVLGGAAPPETLPPNVVTTYGLTESGSGLVYDGIPLDGVEVVIEDDGEIALRGPMLLRAYRDGRDPFDDRGLFHTGDLGSIDEDGRLVVFGRREDVIVSGGEKIWPVPVEQILARHGAVASVALIGVPDPEWQARAVACVVVEPGQEPPALESLRELVRDELGAVYAPRGLVLVHELPRTALGKLRRNVLVAAVMEGTVVEQGYEATPR